MKTITTWHVFGDGWDSWYDSIDEAQKAYREATEDDRYARVRLYEDISEIDGDTVGENYLDGQGDYPS